MALQNKKIVLGDSDVMIIEPIQHKFAWDAFLKGNKNFWLPNEISMAADIALWKSNKLTDEERVVIKRSMGFFATADSIVVNNLVLAVYRHLTSPECRLFLLGQAYQEAIHTLSYQHIIESLNLDQQETYEMYKNVPAVAAKANYAEPFCNHLCNPNFHIQTITDVKEFLKDLVAFYLVFEGIFFYVGFAQIFALSRRNIMTNTAEQIQYIARDEITHYEFGIKLINEIIKENPKAWTADIQEECRGIVLEGAELESRYAYDTMPNGLLGVRASDYAEYIWYITHQRLRSIGLSGLEKSVKCDVTRNPFPWMDEQLNLGKEKNFFETRVTEYQAGGLRWD